MPPGYFCPLITKFAVFLVISSKQTIFSNVTAIRSDLGRSWCRSVSQFLLHCFFYLHFIKSAAQGLFLPVHADCMPLWDPQAFEYISAPKSLIWDTEFFKRQFLSVTSRYFYYLTHLFQNPNSEWCLGERGDMTEVALNETTLLKKLKLFWICKVNFL